MEKGNLDFFEEMLDDDDVAATKTKINDQSLSIKAFHFTNL